MRGSHVDEMTNIYSMLKIAFVFLVASVVSVISAQASKRVALVVGNGAYQNVSALPNPTNDADDVATALRRLNFDVTHISDLDRNDFQNSLADFSEKSDNAEVAIFFFAGHGIEINRENYLIPIDAKLATDSKVRFEAVSLSDVSAAMEGVKGLRLVLLDACRNNPFVKEMKRSASTRSIGRGLAAPEPTVGSLVSFAAKEGTVASDGAGRNSPYTRGLLDNLEKPGLEVNFLFRKVRDSVLEATGGKQEPFTYGSLPGKSIYLKEPVQTAALAPTTQAPAQQLVVPAPAPNNQAEISYWVSIVNLNSKELFQSYVDKYPNGQFTEIARYRIDQISGVKRTLESKVDPAKTAETGQTQVASLNPAPTQPATTVEPPKPAVENKVLSRAEVRSLQSQLNRVGCSVGRADGLWGKASIRGLKNYAKHSNTSWKLQPSSALMASLKGHSNRVCPLVCRRGFEKKGGSCKRIVTTAKVNPKPATKSRSTTPKATTTKRRTTKRRSQPRQQVVEEEVIVQERPRRSRRRERVVEEVIVERPRQRRRRNTGAEIVIQGIIGGVLSNF